MKVSPIASGSNGNCVYVETDSARIIIDMGISFKEFSRRMAHIERDPYQVDACFVTHEHSDHIQGVGVISRKLGIPVYINKGTYEGARHKLGRVSDIRFLEDYPQVGFGQTVIRHFSKPHDAADPVSFIIEDNGKRFGVITDTGFPCDNTKECVANLHSVLLESNYDPKMLETCGYPAYLKKRIASDHGHLSNEDSALMLLENASPSLNSVFLGHLSANSNTPELAYQTFCSLIRHRKDLKDLKVVVTSRYKCIGLFDI
jgi:phosphoribosyl 1,2-cyclic phosphodiesterase